MATQYKLVEMEEVMEESKKDNEEMSYERIEDEYKGWMMYKSMYEKTGEHRYEIASSQEFGHLLIALEDFFACIKKHNPTAMEIQEFNKAKESFRL